VDRVYVSIYENLIEFRTGSDPTKAKKVGFASKPTFFLIQSLVRRSESNRDGLVAHWILSAIQGIAATPCVYI